LRDQSIALEVLNWTITTQQLLASWRVTVRLGWRNLSNDKRTWLRAKYKKHLEKNSFENVFFLFYV